ncbi:MAG: DUF433 domain-containing protein [Candidatus Babeliales bacterium]|jgi:uncharacterized protein (DUF433 family)
MNNEKLLERIAIDPKIMMGKPIIRGTRLTVQQILKLLAEGLTTEEILQEHPSLKRDDISACLIFATETLENTSFIPATL